MQARRTWQHALRSGDCRTVSPGDHAVMKVEMLKAPRPGPRGAAGCGRRWRLRDRRGWLRAAKSMSPVSASRRTRSQPVLATHSRAARWRPPSDRPSPRPSVLLRSQPVPTSDFCGPGGGPDRATTSQFDSGAVSDASGRSGTRRPTGRTPLHQAAALRPADNHPGTVDRSACASTSPTHPRNRRVRVPQGPHLRHRPRRRRVLQAGGRVTRSRD